MGQLKIVSICLGILFLTGTSLLTGGTGSTQVSQAKELTFSPDLANPDVLDVFSVVQNPPSSIGSYTSLNASTAEIRINSTARQGGAVGVAWALNSTSLADARIIRLDFQIMTKVLTPGDSGPAPSGNRITMFYGFTTSAPDCCYDDRGAKFPNGTKIVAVDADCCYAGPFMDFLARLVVDPEAQNSGDRVVQIFDRTFSGFVDDGVFHNYTIMMDLQSNRTIWIVDEGAAVAAFPFSFVPSHIVFWAQAHDTGDSIIAAYRNIRQTSIVEAAISPPDRTPSQHWISQWWFWAPWIVLGLSALLFTTTARLRMRGQSLDILSAQTGLSCPRCGSEMPVNSAFCGSCGSQLREAKLVCPQCRGQTPMGSAFCGNCGNRLGGGA